jgi:hypothetical protein
MSAPPFVRIAAGSSANGTALAGRTAPSKAPSSCAMAERRWEGFLGSAALPPLRVAHASHTLTVHSLPPPSWRRPQVPVDRRAPPRRAASATRTVVPFLVLFIRLSPLHRRRAVGPSCVPMRYHRAPGPPLLSRPLRSGVRRYTEDVSVSGHHAGDHVDGQPRTTAVASSMGRRQPRGTSRGLAVSTEARPLQDTAKVCGC